MINFSRQYKTLNLIKVSQQALLNNFHFFQNQQEKALVAPVLKSNAYGHGLKLIAKFVDDHIKPPYICVDSLYEAYELEKAKTETPILIIGYTNPNNFKVIKRLKFTFPVYDEETIKTLHTYQPGVKVHLKIDTGMNRLGIHPNQIKEFIKLIKKFKKIKVEGIYSHLSQADEIKSKSFTKAQIKTFGKVISKFEQAGINFKWKHISATSGGTTIINPQFNLVRLGLGFYGLSPFPPSSSQGKLLTAHLKPALTLITHIAQVKTIKKGSEVSYAGTFIAKKKMKIAILPIGYYDGVDRRLSNKGLVAINDTYAPIIGRVCMNITVIDVSHLKEVEKGQEVTIFSDTKIDKNSLESSAILANTIPYTLLVNLSETTRRVLI